MKPKIIISGGQTGTDLGALRAAKALGIQTMGYAPKGWATECGPNPDLGTLYNLTEHETSYDYAPRTKANVDMADATLIIGRRSRGSNLTERLALGSGKPMLWLNFTPELLNRSVMPRAKLLIWLSYNQPTILNVAGNRESVNPGIESAVKHFLYRVLSEM